MFHLHSSSSSSSGATTKSSVFPNTIKQNMGTISEEHNSYLAQNLMANAELRTSLLGELMDFDQPNPAPSIPVLNQEKSFSDDEDDLIMAPTQVEPLNTVPSDPFRKSVIEELLRRVCFPGPHTRGYHTLSHISKLKVRKEPVTIGTDKYLVEKELGKGTFGTVFRGIDLKSGSNVALKCQNPANRWEFYICRELQARLENHPLREAFMDVKIGYFSKYFGCHLK